MPDDQLTQSFALAGRQVFPKEHAFTLGMIKHTPGAVDALRDIFNSDLPVQKKSNISTALHGLDAFIRHAKLDARIQTLADFSESDLLAYIQSIPAERKHKRERDRNTLRYFFTQMVERGVITAAQHPVPLYVGRRKAKVNLDAFWGEVGSAGHQAMVDFFNIKHPNWNNLKLTRAQRGRLHYVTTAANFVSYAKRHGITRAEDITLEFAKTYSMTLKQGRRKTSERRQTQTLMRHIFEHRIAANVHEAPNPFPSNMDHPQKPELMIINPVYLARGSDAAHGTGSLVTDKVKHYLTEKGRQSVQNIPGIDQFCFWLVHWRGLTQLEQITRDHVLDYWGHILSTYTERTAKNYFTPILDFLRHLGHPIDKTIHIDKRKRVKKPSPFANVHFLDIWRYYRKQHPSLIKRGTRSMTQHYVLEQLANLVFKDQLHTAVFVEYYGRCKIPPAELVPGYVLKLHHAPGSRSEIGGSYMKAGEAAGLTIMLEGKQHLTKEFVDLLRAPDRGIFQWSASVQAEQKRRLQPQIKRLNRKFKAGNQLG